MIVLTSIFIPLSAYVAYADIKDETKTSYFIFLLIFIVLVVLFSLI